jgi:hypothetical protein
VTVDGEQFDLGKGGLFLISLMDNQTKVEQLATDLSQLNGAPSNATGLKLWHTFADLGKSEPRFQTFWRRAACLEGPRAVPAPPLERK